MKNRGKQTRLYMAWSNMKSRCNNPKATHYEYYGGKGITVCSEWQEFETFRQWAIANGYEDGLSIDRIKCDGQYSPENCRWITHQDQCNNRTSNQRVTSNGETLTIMQWANKNGLCAATIYGRIRKGWNAATAISKPARGYTTKREGITI